MKLLKIFIDNQNLFDRICSNHIIFFKIIISLIKAKFQNFLNFKRKILSKIRKNYLLKINY